MNKVWNVGELKKSLANIEDEKELVFVSDIPMKNFPTINRHDVMMLDTIIDCRNDNAIILRLKEV